MPPVTLWIILFVVKTLASVVREQSQLTVDGSTCTVEPIGNGEDDVPNITQAFKECGQGGTVIFPEGKTYNIATKLNPVVNNVTIEWHGVWQFSTDLGYWRNNSYPISFQNHHAGFVLTGDGIHIDGYGTGGVDGNGDAW